MATKTIFALGSDWVVEFNIYGGTNRMIHSASLEPNDDPELEIISIEFEDGCDEYPEEVMDIIDDKLYKAVEDEIWDMYHRGEL